MKKCALFLICLFSLASCSKNDEMQEVTIPDHQRLETALEQDFLKFQSTMHHFLSGKNQKELLAMEQQINSGVDLMTIDPFFASPDMTNLQDRMYTNLHQLAKERGVEEAEQFINNLEKKDNRYQTQKVYGTPCFDSWNRQMSTVTVILLACQLFAQSKEAITACYVSAAVYALKAEGDYRACIENTY